MNKVQSLTEKGTEAFRQWLVSAVPGQSLDWLLTSRDYTQEVLEREIDCNRQFGSRYDLGCYLVELFSGLQSEELLAPAQDGMWAWLNAVYFHQLSAKGVRRFEHYIPTRQGSAGTLLHRAASRTAFEMCAVHGANARFTLQQSMAVHGQLLESLTASQSIARSHVFFAAAALLYVGADGKLKKGATSKIVPPAERTPGDTTGKGAIRRVPTALKRLDLTYDVSMLTASELLARLPKEFSRWTAALNGSKPTT